MTRAREKVLEEFGPDEAAWASYILYGDPRARLPQTPAATGKPRRIARPLALVGILMAIGILLPSTLGQRAKDAGTAVEEPAATPSGYLTFESEPPGAAVWIDGHQRGATPLTLELDEGTHEVALDLSGHALWEASALVDPDSPQVIHVQLEEAPR
ncbi:MAG: PEGA domain-containing protein [Candidatus Eisenbacteria sp.]|nr:PEGA domain-containing protein [Candidatus Eisenbacteria bacterium]